MIQHNWLAAWLRLAHTPGVGLERQHRLLAAFGLPEHILDASHSAIAALIGTKAASALLSPPDQNQIETALAWNDKPGNHILTLADAEYPRTLLDLADPPILLYVKGNPLLLNHPALAVVGARTPSPQGMENAHAFARYLAQSGLTIVSGLAHGIDAAAHQGALASQSVASTLAVIGTGADRIYPANNIELAREIIDHGAMISEFPLGTAPLRHHFPRRNRIIAALSLGTLVVEASIQSGSLITARLAAETNREVFAIPGSIHSPLARGCHRLIREGAKLVETAQDILEELHGYTKISLTPPPKQPTIVSENNARETIIEKILLSMGHDPVDSDTLAHRCDLTVDTLYAILLTMELDGLIARLAGNRFQRLQQSDSKQ